ncbi:protease adaptor protein RcdA [Ancylobacter lacus]|uniref:protease adaptor protein RcdA n=1 Tax=Ancylobacter lacus TaxID=2579970 RepID=UPI001BCDAAAB|nr:DUF1465 family protein [Ancylobacter lacus]MBS7540194.1 DUF1465 family protein [Ancylobacter lacus]
MNDHGAPAQPVDFRERMLAAQSFEHLFARGMDLVEQTAAYLDGPGREDSRHLSRNPMLIYARESMRLTTRLMQIASWLLLQRTVNEREMTLAEAERQKGRIDLERVHVLPEEEARELPERLLALIDSSNELRERIVRLDAALYGRALEVPNPVNDQIGRLRAAFEAG